MSRGKVAILLIALTILVYVLWGAADRDPNKPPPGMAAQQRLAAKGGLANQDSGTCKTITAAEIQAALGGAISKPMPDTLTPGLDRCTWTITKGKLGAAIRLTAYRVSQAPTAGKKGAGITAVPELGSKATWTAAGFTLVIPYNKGVLGLQILPDPKAKLDPRSVRETLVRLASALTANSKS